MDYFYGLLRRGWSRRILLISFSFLSSTPLQLSAFDDRQPKMRHWAQDVSAQLKVN